MIGEEDGVDAGLLGVSEHLVKGAAGVGGILGVGVQDAAVVVEAGQGRDVFTQPLQALDVVVDGSEPDQREAFQVRVLA